MSTAPRKVFRVGDACHQCFQPIHPKSNHHNFAPQSSDWRSSDSDETELDNQIIRSMNALSFDELQKTQEELHGVSGDKTEKATGINAMLTSMQMHLQRIKIGTAYEEAEKLDWDYVNNRDFQLNFLRSMQYDPAEAAAKMIRHFDFKASFFSRDVLARDVLLSDLDDDDVACLLTGGHQISAVKDRSNRKILIQIPGVRKYKSIDNEMRALFYLYMQIVKSVDYTTRGVIFVYYAVGNFREKTGADAMKYLTVGMTVAHFTAGFHLCYNNKAETMATRAIITCLPGKMKSRMKVHYGSHMECLYRLNTYGIPQHALPISVSKEEVILDSQYAWYRDCLQKENASRNNVGSMVTASEMDVICVGRKVNNAGNDRLLALAAEHADWYNNGNSRERRILVDLIMEEIRKSGGRFLKPDEDSSNEWTEVSVDEARSKIGQLFRNLKKRARSSATTSARRASPEPEEARIVASVGDEDVLFGRMYEHAGNERLRREVEVMAAEYNASSRGRKKQIADSLVQDVKSRGGRFLKPMEGGRWVEVSDKMAETKVSARFRNFRKRTTGEEKLESYAPSLGPLPDPLPNPTLSS